jgi:ADP-glucose pyrophosphorylase
MVGRSPNPGYRGDLNLLSQRDYTRSPARYIRIRVGAIVGFATAQYHCGRRLSKEIHGERLPVAVFAADHVYRMDVRQMLASHCERKADVTVAAVAVALKQASSFGILATVPDGRVREFREKPRHAAPSPSDPTRAYASMETIFSIRRRWKKRCTKRGAGRDRFRPRYFAVAMLEPPGLRLRLCREPRAERAGHEELSYWRDVGTLAALAAAQQDALANPPRFNLWNRRWPIRGEGDARRRARAQPLKSPAPWQAASRDLHSDERLPTS